jgi:hypothetical protein
MSGAAAEEVEDAGVMELEALEGRLMKKETTKCTQVNARAAMMIMIINLLQCYDKRRSLSVEGNN